MLERYGHVRLAAKRAALDGSTVKSYVRVSTQSEGVGPNVFRKLVDKLGGRDRDRTGDLLVANEALSQLSYSPTSSRRILAEARESG
jgi:hypothetical protein